MKKRVLSLLLSLLLILSMVPAAAFADGEEPEEPEQPALTEQENEPAPPIQGKEGPDSPDASENEPMSGEDDAAPASSEADDEASDNEGDDGDPALNETDDDTETDGVTPTDEGNDVDPGNNEDDPAPAAEPVQVVFVCDPADLILTVWAKPETDEEPTPILPEEDGAYLLLPGEYLYSAVAEGYIPFDLVPFTVKVAEEPMTIIVTLSISRSAVEAIAKEECFEKHDHEDIASSDILTQLTRGSGNIWINSAFYQQETSGGCVLACCAMAFENAIGRTITYTKNGVTYTGFQAVYQANGAQDSAQWPVLYSAFGVTCDTFIHHAEYGTRSAAQVKELFLSYLQSNPNGILAHFKPSSNSDSQHAVLIIGYRDGVFYVNDPARYRNGQEIPISQSYVADTLLNTTSQDAILEHINFADVYVDPNHPACDHEWSNAGVCTKCSRTYKDVEWPSKSSPVDGTATSSKPNQSYINLYEQPYANSSVVGSVNSATLIRVGTNHYNNTWYELSGTDRSTGATITGFANVDVLNITLTPILFSNLPTIPATLNVGDSQRIRGTVITAQSTTLKKVVFGVYYANGSATAQVVTRDNINTSSYTISVADDNAIVFGSLPAGSYEYRIYAWDNNGNTAHRSITFSIVGSHTHDKGTYMFYEAEHPHRNAYKCSICGEVWVDEASSNYLTSCDLCLPGQPALIGLSDSYWANEPITFRWNPTEHTTHYNFWLYKQDSSGEYEVQELTFYVESGLQRALDVGNYKAIIQSTDSNHWFSDGSTWVWIQSEPVYFSVVQAIVTYNANGGTGAPGSQYKTYGQALTLSSIVPTRTNVSAGSFTITLNANGGSVSPTSLAAARTTSYAFSTWNTQQNGGGTRYAPGTSYTAEANATLYAQWSSSTSTASVTLPTPTRNGYTFDGWYTAAAGGSWVGNGGASYVPNANCSLYAHWTANQYSVAYHANGGTGAPDNQCKIQGQALTLSNDIPTRANETAGIYTITLNANGGSVETDTLTAARSVVYSFSSWNTQQMGNGTSYAPGASYTTDASVTLYAQWSSSTSTASVSLLTPTRNGYTFDGWYTAASAGDRVGGAGDSYTPNGDVSLYAHWTAAPNATNVILNTTSLSLVEFIGLNIKVTVPPEVKEGATAVFTYMGDTREVPAESWVSTGTANQYVFTQPVAAKEIAESVTLEIRDKNGLLCSMVTANGADYGTSFTTDVERLCMDYEAYYASRDADMAALATALRRYGAAAWTHFDQEGKANGIKAPVNPDNAAENVSDSTFNTFVITQNDGVDGLTLTSMYLTLISETEATLRFTLSSGAAIGDYTFTWGNTTLTPVNRGTSYTVTLRGIKAKELANEQTIRVKKGTQTLTVTLSALSYGRLVMGNGSASNELKTLVRSLYLYGQAAKTYFNKQ